MKPSWLITLFFLLGSLLGACQKDQGPKLPPPKGEGSPPLKPVPTLTELARDVAPIPTAAATRAGTGSLRPIREAALGPKQTGVLSAITVEEGDRVKKGQLLFRQDAGQAQLNIEQARAAVAGSKVQLAQAQLDLDRTRALRERGSIPQDTLDQALTRVNALTSALQQSEAALGMASKGASDMSVSSPIDGVVAEKRMNVGETATLMPPSIVLVIQDIDTLELRARVPEAALRTVREGTELSVRFPAVDETRSVKIKRIAPNIDPRTRTIELVADVPNKDGRLKAGMLAEVSYEHGEHAAAAPAQTGKVADEDR
jgi:RND family efflux transporter MFP subunit